MRRDGPLVGPELVCAFDHQKLGSKPKIRGVSHMTSLVALSISIGVLGAVAAWLALGPLSAYLAIWIIFIGWATYFATGGDTAGLKTTIVSGIWGAICAWVALMILKTFPLDLGQAVWPAIVVGATVLVLCLGAHVEALKNI